MQNINLVKCTEDDFDSYYYLRCDPVNIIATGHKNMPDYSRLKSWFNENIKIRSIYFAYYNFNVIGYAYIDTTGKKAEISYSIHSEFQGKGMGKILVKELVSKIKKFKYVNEVCAWIGDFNEKSRRCAYRNGFTKTGNYQFRYFEKIDDYIKFEEYVFNANLK